MPAWPLAVPYAPLRSSYRVTPRLAPISTEMEGGNVRLRRRPGDNVAVITQTIRMTDSEYAALDAWLVSDISEGVARFTMDVWLGDEFVNKTVQFQAGQNFPYAVSEPFPDAKDVDMTLRVYDV